MELYVKFLASLAFGLVGVGMVLKILLEKLFSEWDAFAELGQRLRMLSEGRALAPVERTEDVLLEIEKSKQSKISTRLVDLKREQLKELSVVEHRLRLPRQAILTPSSSAVPS